MTRKHFKQIAETISKISDLVERRKQAESMATICADANPRFNRAIFFAACDVNE